MSTAICILVCFAAGIGAGLGTGFAGMSAAAVISPCLLLFWVCLPMRRLALHWRVMCWQVLSVHIHTEKQKS